MTTLEKQVALEYRMVQSGVERYNKQKDDLITKGLSAKTVHGRTIISGVVQAVSDSITDYMQTETSNRAIAKKLIVGMNPDTLAFLALITIIDTVASYHTLIKVSRLVGTQIETQKRLELWLQEEGNVAKNSFNEKHECALPRFSPCVIEPKDWEGFYGGGYYSEHIYRLPLVRVHR